MPIKSSLGALRQFIDFSDLQKIYFLDLFKTSGMAGGFFDSLGHYHFMATDVDKMVELDVFNNASNVKLYSNSLGVGNISNFDIAEDHTLLLKYSLANGQVGCSKIDANSYSSLGTITRAGSILGNVQITSSNAYVLTGQHTATDEGVVVSSTSGAKYLSKPGGPGYTFQIIALDGVTDGTNTYVGGSFNDTSGGPGIEGGFLVKLNQFGIIQWNKNVGFQPTNIKLIDNDANLLISGINASETEISVFKVFTSNGQGAGNRFIANNAVAPSPAIIRTQSLDIDSTGNIIVGGQYRDSGGSVQNGFVIGLDSSMNSRFVKKFTSTMPGPASMTIKNVSQNFSQNTLCFAGSNFDTSNSYGLLLSVPYDGTSPGSGSYVLDGVTTTYVTTTDITGSTVGNTTYANGNVTVSNATGVGSANFTLSNSTFSFSSLEI